MRSELALLAEFFRHPKQFYAERPHRVRAWAWVLLAVPSLLWWKESILWVIVISLYANWETSLGADEADLAKKEAQNNADPVRPDA